MLRLDRLIAAALVFSGFLLSQDARAGDDFVSDDWQFTVTPYMWFLSLDGDATVKGQSADVDVGFSDIWKNFDIGVMTEAEVRKGRLGVFGNIIYADLEADTTVAGFKIDAEATALWSGLGAYYRLGPWDLDSAAGSQGPQVIVDPYLGPHCTYLDLGVDIKGAPNSSADQDWVDPIVGFRSIWQFDSHWSLATLGNIGGLGVGSDFTLQTAGRLGYRFSLFSDQDSRFLIGYRALAQDYETGSGADKFEWDITAHGPMTGLAISL